MLQIFYKTSQIKASDWARVYSGLVEVATNFPVQLLRLESYNGYEKGLDKFHENLICLEGEKEEHLSIYADKITQSGQASMDFYRDWEMHKKKVLVGKEADTSQPITWFSPQRFYDDGILPEANGQRMHSEIYLDPEGTFSQYAMIAFGIFLENELPGRVLYIGFKQKKEAEKELTHWLEGHFRRGFSLPIYHSRSGITDTFQTKYTDEKDAVNRVEHLYQKQYLRNMQFSLQRFAYDSVFRCYAEVLAIHRFGTYGFYDVLNPWIAAVQDLEKVLDLLSESQKIRKNDRIENEQEPEENYDYTRVLRDLLNAYILWSPTQREYLRQLPNNENFTQTGEQDLFGILRRISGMQIDICPIVAEREELLHAFIFHDPKKGKAFEDTIKKWEKEHKNDFEKLRKAIDDFRIKQDNYTTQTSKQEDSELEKTSEIDLKINAYLSKFAEHERSIVSRALSISSQYLRRKEIVDTLCQTLETLIEKEADHYSTLLDDSLEEIKNRIFRRIKQRRFYLNVDANFESRVLAETDKNVLLRLCVLPMLKLYDSEAWYARMLILQNEEYWDRWRADS